MSRATKVYRFRLKPTKAQTQMLRQFAGARRFVWNWTLARRKAYYETTGKPLSRKILSAELPLLKKQAEQHRRSAGLPNLAWGATVRPPDQRLVAANQESLAL